MWALVFISTWLGTTLSQDCRKLFHESHEDEKSCLTLVEKTNTVTDKSTALLVGYKGAGLMMQSKYEKGALTKLSLFNRGKAWLEKAIKRDNNSLELRYIRFCFQSTVPGLLNYNRELDNDKTFIMKKTPQCSDADLKNKIRTFMLKSEKVTESEKTTIKTKWSR